MKPKSDSERLLVVLTSTYRKASYRANATVKFVHSTLYVKFEIEDLSSHTFCLRKSSIHLKEEIGVGKVPDSTDRVPPSSTT